jgi:hypothetical protein
MSSDDALRIAVSLARDYLLGGAIGTTRDPKPGDLVVEMENDIGPDSIGWLVRHTKSRKIWRIRPLGGGEDRRWVGADFWKIPDPIITRAGLREAVHRSDKR